MRTGRVKIEALLESHRDNTSNVKNRGLQQVNTDSTHEVIYEMGQRRSRH